jgi:hypothetical protein
MNENFTKAVIIVVAVLGASYWAGKFLSTFG